MKIPIKKILRPYWRKAANRIFKSLKTFEIINAETTIAYIQSHRVSVSRFGDGEFIVMQGNGMGFQDANEALAERLKEILRTAGRISNHIICLPYPLESTEGLVERARMFWWNFVGGNCWSLLKVIPSKAKFYDTNFTRFYIDYQDKSHSQHYINEIKKIWKDREVVIIEGKGTRMGVGNDLLDGAVTIKRILCPSTNAFEVYDKILNFIEYNIEKNVLILCALGMTATVLAYDLSLKGYQTIDIGHLDIEYEWFLMQAQEKCAISGKSVNECGAQYVEDIVSPFYHKQIICSIL